MFRSIKCILYNFVVEKLIVFGEEHLLKRKRRKKMVHGMAKSFDGGLDKDPLYRQMLRAREDHARKQDRDYSHIFR
jgi:hypothetical protein